MSGAAASVIAQIAIIDAIFLGLVLYDPKHSIEFIEKTVDAIKTQKV